MEFVKYVTIAVGEMMKKIMLAGLRESEYIHPDEAALRGRGEKELLEAGLDKLNDFSVALMRRMTLGRYTEVTEKTAPELMKIVKDVCCILDYPKVPRLYICHQAAQTIFCAGTDNIMLVVSDYIVEYFNQDMLYYVFGNAVSMFKSGHVRLVTAYAMMPGTIMAKPVELALKHYLRAADMTSDRGGLLACQSFTAAAKCILWDAGLPLGEIQILDEKETIQLSERYIGASLEASPGLLADIMSCLKRYDMESMPCAYRLKELLAWYRSGYQEIMGKRGYAL